MNHKALALLVFVIIILIVLDIFFLLIIPDKNMISSSEFTGDMKTFEVYSDDYSVKQFKTDDKYNRKLLDYLDSKQDSRSNTFFR